MTIASVFATTKKYVIAHKLMSAVVVIIILAGGWWFYSKATATSTETRYVLGMVEKGTVIASVSASGQVSASNQVDLTSKSSGDIVSLNVRSGQEVRAGALIAQVDPGNAAYELESAKLSYDTLVTIDPDTLVKAKQDVTDAYTSARASLTSASTQMADTMESLKTFFDCNKGYLGGCQGYRQNDPKKGYRDTAESSWSATDARLYDLSKKYQTISSTSSNADIDSVVQQSYDAAIAVAQTAKYVQDAVVYFRNQADNGSEQSTEDAAYTAVIPIVSSANAIVSSLTTTKNAMTTAARALDTVMKGPDTLDARASALAVRQKQEALDAYYIRAPFDGVVANVAVKYGQNINSGTSVATLITKQKIAELSLNEVDAAKVQLGDKATLTFDAIDGLSLTGSVAQINGVGTVTQGVVSYAVQITFDSQDDRVKSGMTINAAIITDAHQNVLIVPATAVKQQNGTSYVLVFDPALSATGGSQGVTSTVLPQQVPVEVGISDDTNTEILSGLSLGQQVVARTISGTTATAVSTAPSLFGAVGGNRGGTGAVRAPAGR